MAHPALVTLAQELAALGQALVSLIAEDDRFLTLEWHGGGLSHPMLSGTDFWSISTGNVEIEAEPYVAAFPAAVEIGTWAQAAFDATGIAMRWASEKIVGADRLAAGGSILAAPSSNEYSE